MDINALNNIMYAYNTPYKPAPEQLDSPKPTTGHLDNVTISDEAKALAAAANNAVFTQQRTPAQENLLRAASSDRASAEKIASDLAKAPSMIMWDISGQRGVGDGKGEFVRKLSSTGEVVDDNYVSKFNKEASVIDVQRRSIYETEKAKGTDPLEILEKMIDFTNMQSQTYLDATGWGGKRNSTPT